jgi:hypothetical protein
MREIFFMWLLNFDFWVGADNEAFASIRPTKEQNLSKEE